MRWPRVALDAPAWHAGGTVLELSGPVHRHLARVCRLRPGDFALGVTPDGEEWLLAVLEVGPRTMSVRVAERRRPDIETAADVTLAVAPPRGQRMDWLVEKATELGACRIVPLVAERAAAPAEAGAARVSRWDRKIKAATAQSRRVGATAIAPPATLAVAVAGFPGPCLFGHVGPGAVPLPEALAALGRPARLLWAVGPEGGFTGREVESARAAGAVAVSLGPRILRVETAAIAGLAVAMAALGEMAPRG